MRKVLILIAIALFIISCNFHHSDMTLGEFSKLYMDSLVNKFPSLKFKLADDSTILTETKENNIRISVDNAFKEYQSEPDSLKKILTKFIKVTSEMFAPRQEISAERIVPIIKPIEYLDDVKNAAKEMGGGKDAEGVYEKYNDKLIIVYAEDTKNSIIYLTHDDLKQLSLKQEQLKALAIKNLNNILTNINKKGSNGVYMLTAGGDYEASLILLDNVLSKDSLPVNGDFVVSIPNRDMLLITGSHDQAGILKIKEIAKKSYETGNYQVSEHLFKWNGKIFENFD